SPLSACCPSRCTLGASPRLSALSLHDALPICVLHRARVRSGFQIEFARAAEHLGGDAIGRGAGHAVLDARVGKGFQIHGGVGGRDRKSTRLNSSHASTTYAVFRLTNKNNLTAT